MKIFIDAGHNFMGADTGAIGNGIREQDVTFEIADKLKALLISKGHSVKMSRNSLEESLGATVSESLSKRCAMSNEWGADLFVSIHCNAGGGNGTETYVYSAEGKAYETAKRVNDAIVNKLSLASRGVKQSKSLYVLKNTEAPAMLIETAFIDSNSDREKLVNRQNEFALAIFEGLTGEKVQSELTEINDIVWELAHRGIITDKELWIFKLKEDTNAYWLARKIVNYMIGKGI